VININHYYCQPKKRKILKLYTGIAKPNWEGDCSVITLKNLTPEELELNPWRLKAIERPFVDCIPYVQDRQNEWSEEKYQQVIDSIKELGGEIDNYTI